MHAGVELDERAIRIIVGQEATLFGANIFVGKDGIKGWNGGDFRREAAARKNAHGSYRKRGWRDARVVSIEGEWWTDTRAQAAEIVDRFGLLMGDGNSGSLSINDPDQGFRWARHVYLQSTECDWDTELGGTFALDIECSDPRKYAELPTTATTGIQRSLSGLVFPLFVPDGAGPANVLDFGPAMGSSGLAAVTNRGTAPTSVLFRVNGGGNPNGFVITEQETGRRLVYDYELPASQELTLNSADGTVWLMGYAPRESGLSVDEWMEIPAKTTRTYHFEGRDGGDDSELTVEAYSAWW